MAPPWITPVSGSPTSFSSYGRLISTYYVGDVVETQAEGRRVRDVGQVVGDRLAGHGVRTV